MFSMLSVISIALAAASTVSAGIIPRHRSINALQNRAVAVPSTYAEGYLEAYTTYHTRYLAIGCKGKQNTTFFDECCHPLLATETLAKNRPAQCNPSASQLSSASVALPTVTDVPSGNPDDDCTDEPTSTATPTSTKKAAATTTSAPVNIASTPSKMTTKKATSTTSKKATATTSASGALTTGGIATFFTQNGVAGACGKVHKDSDLVAALDTPTYDNGKHCGKMVQITNLKNGKTVDVLVADECPTCENKQSIDLSTGAYKALGGTVAEGIFNIAWKFL